MTKGVLLSNFMGELSVIKNILGVRERRIKKLINKLDVEKANSKSLLA